MLALIVCTVLVSLMAVLIQSMISRQHSLELQHAVPVDFPQESRGLVTHLPILRIDTGGEPIPWVSLSGEPRDGLPAGTRLDPDCTVELIWHEGEWNTEADEPFMEAPGTIRIRGNSSRNFDKKSYLLRFINERGGNKSRPLVGMAAGAEWVLNGPILDRTLLRNYLCYTVAGEVMDYAPDSRYCELILNGEYRGVYLLVSAITREKGRLDLTESKNRNSPVTSWIVRWDRDGKGDMLLPTFTYYTYKDGVSSIDLRYPGESIVTEEKAQYVIEEISAIEREIYATGHCDKLDLEEFARYFVLNEFFGNVDAGRFSTFYYKDVRGKVKPVVWDFNNAMNNYIDYEYGDDGFYLIDAPWFSGLLQNKDFVEEVIAEYRALRFSILSDESLTAMIDETVAFLGNAVDRNYEVWGYVFVPGSEEGRNYLQPAERNYYSYEESVEQLKSWMTARGRWLDKNIETLLQFCHESRYSGFAK